jgi:hypothetical protein
VIAVECLSFGCRVVGIERARIRDHRPANHEAPLPSDHDRIF